MTTMKIPLRSSMKGDNNFYLNKKYEYDNTKNYGLKPKGFWYQIKMGIYDWGQMSWGDHMYAIDICPSKFTTIISKPNPRKILVIETFEDLKKFEEKYHETFFDVLENINWERVCKDYGGIEFKNYSQVKSDMYKNMYKMTIDQRANYIWFTSIDFNSGCIWNLYIIDGFKYYKELTNDEIEQYQERDYNEPYLKIDHIIKYNKGSRIIKEITKDMTKPKKENRLNYLIYFLPIIIIWLPLYLKPQLWEYLPKELPQHHLEQSLTLLNKTL